MVAILYHLFIKYEKNIFYVIVTNYLYKIENYKYMLFFICVFLYSKQRTNLLIILSKKIKYKEKYLYASFFSLFQ
jgi:hypothetical protein